MKPPTLVFRKGKGLIGFEVCRYITCGRLNGGLLTITRIQFGALIRSQDNAESQWGTRKFSTTTARLALNPTEQHSNIANNGRESLGHIGSRARGKLADRVRPAMIIETLN